MTPPVAAGRASFARARRWRAARRFSAAAALLLAAAGASLAQQPALEPLADADCATLARTPWPITASGRARLLTRLEDQREACIDNAAFLALLGALWLEQGDPAQALLWLERALMLDPTSPATQADHALALAAMGERTAARELLERWSRRSDVPPALRARLEAAARTGSSSGFGAGRVPVAGHAAGLTWRRTMSLLRGHETNLDHSPRLSEITLSSPDGPIELPLAVPLVPRRGAAWAADAAMQALYSPDAVTLWQGGVQLGARHAEREPETDTRQLQLAASRWRQHSGWRSQLHLAVQRVAGPLNEPFNTYSVGLAGEREWNGCWSRLGLDAEWRRQDKSRVVDSQTTALQLGTHCRLAGPGSLAGWTGGLALRVGLDRPRQDERPGGAQKQSSIGLRAAGPLAWGFRLEMSARASWLLDRQGYSPLLEYDARRRQRQHQVNVELSRPLPALHLTGLDLVLQVQQLDQTSNIELFNRNGRSAFAGLRLDW